MLDHMASMPPPDEHERYEDAQRFARDVVPRWRRAYGDAIDERDKGVRDCVAKLRDVLDNHGNTNSAMAVQEELVAKMRRTVGEADDQTLRQTILLSKGLEVVGQMDLAERYLREALTTARRAHGEGADITLSAYMATATLLMSRGYHRDAEPLARSALAGLRRVCDPDSPHIFQATTLLAQALFNKGDPASLEEADKVLTMCREPRGSEAATLHARIKAARGGGASEDALSLAQSAVEDAVAAFGETSVEALHALAELGKAQTAAGKADGARATLRRAAKAAGRMKRSSEGEALGWALHKVGEALVEARLFADAEPVLQRACAMLERAVGAGHFKFLDCLAVAALAMKSRGDLDGALAAARRVLAGFQALLKPEDVRIAMSKFRVCCSLQALPAATPAQLAEAEALGREALVTLRASGGEEDPLVPLVLRTVMEVAARGRALADTAAGGSAVTAGGGPGSAPAAGAGSGGGGR